MVPDGCCEAVTDKPKRDPLDEIKKIEARRKVADAKTNYAIGELKDQLAMLIERVDFIAKTLNDTVQQNRLQQPLSFTSLNSCTGQGFKMFFDTQTYNACTSRLYKFLNTEGLKTEGMFGT